MTHSKPPALVDTTVVSAELGMIGAIGAMSQGHDIVVKNNIADPSGEMAHEIATAYAAANGGRVAETPIPDDSFEGSAKLDNLIQAAGGARYVVQVAPPQMDLIYFALDIMHRDILFGSSVRIIDTSNQKVVAKARCFLRTKKTPDLMTHDELLADQAAGLKALIQRKSDACVTKLKSDLKI